MAAIDRLNVRLSSEGVNYDQAYLQEVIQTMSDRVTMRLGVVSIPGNLAGMVESVIVDASVKLVMRKHYEGLSSEGASDGGSLSVSFVENILAEYDTELSRIRAIIANEDEEDPGIPTIRFL